MSRAIVTHFDGDPFTLNAWLRLYAKYWRTETDKIYLTITHIPGRISPEVEAYNLKLLSLYPEIKVTVIPHAILPESANQQTLKQVTEDYIGLIESDGLIYGAGIVDQCFRLMENQGQDIVAPPWKLITDPYFNGDLHSSGFMRCFTFVKKSILEKTDMDFLPRHIARNVEIVPGIYTQGDYELDCFGWLSWQLLLLTDKTTYTPANVLGPGNTLNPYSNFKWVHVRQMSSSALGLGGGEYDIWVNGGEKEILNRVLKLYNAEFPNGPAEYIHIKALAFKLFFWDILEDKQALGTFSDDYRQMLESVMDFYNIPRHKVYEIKGFYKGLFNI